MELNFATKELYEVSFKTTDNMKIFGKQYKEDEVFLYFNNIQMSAITSDQSITFATGGKSNFQLVGWQSAKAVDFTFEHGMINKTGFGLLSNSDFINSGLNGIDVPIREQLTANGTAIIRLKYIVAQDRSVFIYKVNNGIVTEMIADFVINENEIQLLGGNEYAEVVIDYYFPKENISFYQLGGDNISGFFKMTSKIYFVDEKEGLNQTVLFVMPKVKIISNLDLILGSKANPIISTFRVTGFPDKTGNTLARFFFLEEDIEG